MHMTALQQLKALSFSAIKADICTSVGCTADDIRLALMHCEVIVSISKLY